MAWSLGACSCGRAQMVFAKGRDAPASAIAWSEKYSPVYPSGTPTGVTAILLGMAERTETPFQADRNRGVSGEYWRPRLEA